MFSSGSHPHPWSSNRLLPGGHSTFNGRLENTPAYGLPCGPTSPQPHVWQGQTLHCIFKLINIVLTYCVFINHSLLSSHVLIIWGRAPLKSNFKKMYSSCPQVFGQANTPLKRWLLDFAYRRKEAELKNGVVRKDSMWDKLIFKKVQVSIATCYKNILWFTSTCNIHVSFTVLFGFTLCRRVWAVEWDSWLQEQHRCHRPSWRSCELLWAVRWATCTPLWLFWHLSCTCMSPIVFILFGCSSMKATVKLNVQLVAPCQCLETGQQVKYIH